MCVTRTNHSQSILLIRPKDAVVSRVQAAPSAEGAGPHKEAGDCGGAPRRHTHLLLPVPPFLPHLQLAAHPRLLDPLPGGRARRRTHCTLLPSRQEARNTPSCGHPEIKRDRPSFNSSVAHWRLEGTLLYHLVEGGTRVSGFVTSLA
jgi:hypothetical protein